MSRSAVWVALLFIACTAPPAPSTATAAAPLPAPPPAVPAEPPPATPAEPPAVAPPTGPIVSWWCVCYSRTTADGGAPVTACRSTEKECHSLENAVAVGHKGMIARSLSHPCQELKAEHPGDVHGGRAVWQASKKAGSWLSLGGCQLPGEGELSQAESGPNPMGDEVIGGLRRGMPAAEVVALLGEPRSRGKIWLEAATGSYVQDWSYTDQGLAIGMAANTRKGPQKVSMLTVKAPSTFKTIKDIGIGSPRKAVLAAYGNLRDPADPSGDLDEVFIAGSVYGGVMFTFAADKVTEIFVGAAAE